MANGTELAKAYVQIIPSADGIKAKLEEVLGKDIPGAAEESGSTFGEIFANAAKVGLAGLTAATAAVAAFSKASVETGMQFDSSMSQVAATMGTTVDSIQELRDFAMEMGASTAFSASEAADALNYMALAGYDAEQSMTMLPNVLNLAAAGGMELAAASDMITDSQTALGLSFDQTNTLVDQMAKTASTTNTSVSQLGEAILTVGGTAKNLAGGTDELNAVLGVMADNGIKGAEAGTHLRNIMLAMTPTTDAAVAAFEQLGLQAYDSEGNLRSLDDIFLDLQGSLDGMTAEERTDILNKIFNKTDLTTVNALLGTTADRWDEVYVAIGNADGAAEAMADTQLDNLAGDITIFQSALEGAQIVISDQLTPTLREFVQFGTDAVSTLSTAFQEGGLSGAMEALGVILSDGLAMVIDMLPAMIDAGMQLLGAVGQGILDNIPTLIEAAAEIVVTIATGIGQALPTLIPSVVETLITVVSTIVENLPLILDAGMQILGGLTEGIMNALPLLVGQLPTLISSICGFITNNLPSILDQGSQMILTLATGILDTLPQFVAQLPAVITSVVEFVTANLPQIVETGVSLLIQLGVGIIQAIPQLVVQLPQVISAIVGGFASIPGTMLNIGISVVQGLIAGISSAWGSLVSWFTGLFDDLVGGVMSILGIHSPSKVFAGIGGYMAEGLGDGWDDEYSDIKKSIEDDFDFGPTAKALTMDLQTSGRFSGGIANTSSTNIGSLTCNIYAQEGQDGRQLAREFMAEAQMLIEQEERVFA